MISAVSEGSAPWHQARGCWRLGLRLQVKAVTMDSEAKLGPGIRARSARTLCQERAITQKGGGRGKVTGQGHKGACGCARELAARV